MCDHCGCRNFAPIAELTGEHDEILRLAWQVVEATHATEAEQARMDLRALLDLHVRKEEFGLYPLLVACGRITRMRSDDLEEEHVEIRRSLAGGDFIRRDYYALAAHVEDEETDLFPAARFAFDEEEWALLEAAHRAAEEYEGGRSRRRT